MPYLYDRSHLYIVIEFAASKVSTRLQINDCIWLEIITYWQAIRTNDLINASPGYYWWNRSYRKLIWFALSSIQLSWFSEFLAYYALQLLHWEAALNKITPTVKKTHEGKQCVLNCHKWHILCFYFVARLKSTWWHACLLPSTSLKQNNGMRI